jgi:hypothetical protein
MTSTTGVRTATLKDRHQDEQQDLPDGGKRPGQGNRGPDEQDRRD